MASGSSVSGWHETSGLGHREAHVGKETRGAALVDGLLGRRVRLRRGRTDDVDSKLPGGVLQLGGSHRADAYHPLGSLPVKAIVIHEDGGPEVLRYEEAPDPVAGAW